MSFSGILCALQVQKDHGAMIEKANRSHVKAAAARDASSHFQP